MKRHDVDIGWDAIEVGHVVGMRSVWFEADVVRGEVALELQICGRRSELNAAPVRLRSVLAQAVIPCGCVLLVSSW
jgi:hypothetical protein